MFTLAILGRPNVGKSTLFNRLAGKKLAIVNDQPGVTRDWREAEGHLFGEVFKVVDTAGLEEKFDGSIPARMRKQTEAALDRADVILFVIDGRAGVTPMDEHFAGWLRKQKKPIILAVNKIERGSATHSGIAEAYSLGMGEPIAISAEHGEGLDSLFHALTPYFATGDVITDADRAEDSIDIIPDDFDDIEGDENYEFKDPLEAVPEEEKSLKIAIVGRPNVGKSTLMNAILQEERVMTGPEAGITRDSIAVDFQYNEHLLRLVDTAGMRRRAKVQDVIEKLSVVDSMRAIRLAHVVIVVLDGNTLLDKQDIQIAEHVLSEGRALVIAVNKWDAVDDKNKAVEDLKYKMETSLAQVKDIPWITISAIQGKNIDKLLQAVVDTYALWNRRVPTAGLNRWLKAKESQNAPPLVDGRSNRLKYITQIKARPPTFGLWVSRAGDLPDSYQRYLIHGLRRDFDLPGVPLRLLIRKSKNPFTD